MIRYPECPSCGEELKNWPIANLSGRGVWFVERKHSGCHLRRFAVVVGSSGQRSYELGSQTFEEFVRWELAP